LDKLKTPDDATADTTLAPTIRSLKNNATVKKDSAATKIKPKEVVEFEKKHGGRKKVKVVDGTTKH
ncbi:hypothetical protein, partial [Streptomyces scabiei]|uniref:hypothetical protein n=1 Tax=Streptomyces scabiei TaxID=1930 RepID=UPI0038F7AE0E